MTLVRLRPPAGGIRRIGAELTPYPSLWAYAQNLYEREAFQVTTQPTRFPDGGRGLPCPAPSPRGSFATASNLSARRRP